MLKTAVVILNWNGIGFLKKFLQNVIVNSSLPGTKVFVADNGSTDGSAEWVETNCREAGLIKLDKNHGFAGGYNIALELISSTYYIILNSDIEVTPGWLEPLTDHLDHNPDVAACQPKILSYNRKDYFEYAGAAGGFIDKYGYPFCRGRIFNVTEKDSGQYNDGINIFWASGACMAVRSDAWKECGGFDSGFFAHMEEIDLCWRLWLAGYKITCVPSSSVYHVGGGALPYSSPYKAYLNFRNSLSLLYKNLKEEEMHRILFFRRLLDGVAAIKFLLTGSPGSFRAVWMAHRDYNRNIPVLREKRKEAIRLRKGDFSAPVLNKSIVFEFYAKGNKTFDRLKF
ncbi:MAG TPA: glycosyltransferase family 2 protein [Bacteroidales bacterium]|nr:glycosyltransferase family 2 protein [Bacteroidales bacterium]